MHLMREHIHYSQLAYSIEELLLQEMCKEITLTNVTVAYMDDLFVLCHAFCSVFF